MFGVHHVFGNSGDGILEERENIHLAHTFPKLFAKKVKWHHTHTVMHTNIFYIKNLSNKTVFSENVTPKSLSIRTFKPFANQSEFATKTIGNWQLFSLLSIVSITNCLFRLLLGNKAKQLRKRTEMIKKTHPV